MSYNGIMLAISFRQIGFILGIHALFFNCAPNSKLENTNPIWQENRGPIGTWRLIHSDLLQETFTPEKYWTLSLYEGGLCKWWEIKNGVCKSESSCTTKTSSDNPMASSSIACECRYHFLDNERSIIEFEFVGSKDSIPALTTSGPFNVTYFRYKKDNPELGSFSKDQHLALESNGSETNFIEYLGCIDPILSKGVDSNKNIIGDCQCE